MWYKHPNGLPAGTINCFFTDWCKRKNVSHPFCYAAAPLKQTCYPIRENGGTMPIASAAQEGFTTLKYD
jgi:hypothetical protein